MGWAIIHGLCAACKTPISYNPHCVPSLVLHGRREAICAACHGRWNEIHRVSKGIEPVALHPEAFEPIHETDL